MSNLILGKRYRGAIRMTENNDGQLRQVITIYPEEGKGKTKVASFVTEHGKVEVSQQSLFVKMKLPLPDYILVNLLLHSAHSGLIENQWHGGVSITSL